MDATVTAAKASNGVQGIAFSPDQKLMAVMGSIGTTMQLFSKAAPVKTLPQLRTVADPSIAFLDDRRLVTFPSIDAPPDTLLEIIDTDDPVQRTFVKGIQLDGSIPQNRASSFCLSYDRKTIAVLHRTGERRFIALVDVATLSTRFVDVAAIVPNFNRLISIACSSDGSVVAFGSISGNVFLLDASTMKMRSSFTAFGEALSVGVTHLAISPDDRILVVGPGQRATNGPLPDPEDPRNGLGMKLWRLPDGVFVYTDGGAGAVRDFAWSPTSRLVAIARDDMVSLLDVDVSRLVASISTGGTATVVFQPDGDRFAFGDRSEIRLSSSMTAK